ncbi:MAG TPA: glutathione transferase [Kofleriaceae bacterium]|nr:glutathione transferase [Kofleriaceae bacterium]
MIKLYSDARWDSPWVFTAFVALTEKGLAFTTEDVDLGKGQQRAGEYASRSLTSRVPMLEHDGFHLTESMAIVEYLEESFAPPGHPALLPADARERARVRQVLNWLRTDLGALREERSTETMFYQRATAPLSDGARAAADKLFTVAGALLADGRDTVASRWTLADSDLAFCLHRLIRNGDSVPPRLDSWARAQWQRPSVKAYVDHPR